MLSSALYKQQIPSRDEMVRQLASGEEFDVVIVGGGATGSGAALDAASRGMKVALVEQEDFASGTSSRSSKLLWGGSRYLVMALMNLFSPKLLTEPVQSVKTFMSTFTMVQNCMKERGLLLEKQSHLTWWTPLAVYHDKWFAYPPPFGYPAAALGPMGLFAVFFKFYDFIGGFRSPPSHIMTKARARRKFPHLDTSRLKYCSVFYEGMHDDSRTNIAIAQTASLYGASIANYLEVTSLLHKSDDNGSNGEEVCGVVVKDGVSKKEFQIRGKAVLFCGGPFTDNLRAMEDENKKKVVKGASGVHIVLPGYYAPSGMGMVDMNTSDGRFLFFLPWHDHVVVGTTDRPASASMRPEPTETEIKWILNEASKYLNPELVCRRSDVLSAWCGVRPLAEDPSASSSSDASRDHVLHFDEESKVTWISGGKWTTYREMAEDAIDKVIEMRDLGVCCTQSAKSRTADIPLVGNHGFSNLLPVRLVQEYGVAESIARRLSRAYGGRAFDVMHIEREELGRTGRGVRLTPGYPILEAEVIFSARHDWAVTVIDFLANRTRLAYLNKDVALSCIPRVAGVMQKELKWTDQHKDKQIADAIAFLDTFGGDKPKRDAHTARLASTSDIAEAFLLVTESNPDENGVTPEKLDRRCIDLVCHALEFPLDDQELDNCMASTSSPNALISLQEFEAWFNSDAMNPHLETFRQSMSRGTEIKGGGAAFS